MKFKLIQSNSRNSHQFRIIQSNFTNSQQFSVIQSHSQPQQNIVEKLKKWPLYIIKIGSHFY
jgi:hypothetical protein